MRKQAWERTLNAATSGLRHPIPNLGISNDLRALIMNRTNTLSAEVAVDDGSIKSI